MNISTNLIQQITKQPLLTTQNNTQVQQNGNYNKDSQMPSNYILGESLVNSNLPISYSKIGEISVPGLKDKASIFKLANGQRVIILPKKGPTYIKTTYNVGSLNETEDIRGISHYIEHNLFNGSKGLGPKEYDKKVADLGGSTNASTGFSQTDYYLSLQLLNENSLEQAIILNAMQTQFPTFPVEQLQKEKEPVKSEIDLYKDDPTDVATGIMLKNLFNIQTNSSNFILGTKDNINSFTREKVFDYFNTWYTPDNAVTVITGDVDVDKTIKLVSKYYNKQPDLSKVSQRHYEPIKYNDKPIRTDIIQQNASSASLLMGFAIPDGATKEEQDKIIALMSLLTASDSKLSKALDKYGLNIDFYIESMQNKPDGAKAIIIYASPTEAQIEDVLRIIYSAINDIANNPPSNEDLEIYKRKSIIGINNLSEESEAINYTLTTMAMENDYNYFNDKIRNLQNMTPIDISETARKFLDLSKVSLCVSHEKTATIDSVNNNYSSANNNRIVSFGSAGNPKETIAEEKSKVKMYKLPNNIETMIIPSNPGISSTLSIYFDTNELNNITSPAFMVINELLNRGSCFKDNDTYNKLLNSQNIGLSFSVGVDGLSVSSVFEDENMNDIMQLIKEVLTYPNFSQSEFERAKQIVKDSILSEYTSPMDKLSPELFPGLKKYDSKEERLKQLDALTIQDIQNLYSTIFATSQVNATLTAPIETKPYLQNIFHNELSIGFPVFKPFSKENSPSYNIYSPNTESKVLKTIEEKSQAEIYQAYKYKKSKNVDDIAKIELLNIILGQGMSSRLFTDLRENEKLAYSVGSEISIEKDTEAMILAIGTTSDSPNPMEGSPENVTKALAGFKRNVDKLRTEPVSQKELDNAKIKYKTQILNYFETNTGKNGAFSTFKYSPYDTNHYEALLDAIDRVSIEDIKAAANYVFANPPITSIVASKKTFDALNL